MKDFMRTLTLNKKLALVAFVLGFIALFAGNPYGSATVKMDTSELATIVQNELDHVDVGELAGWIILGKADYRLLDLRTGKEYEEYHIPGAENVPLTEFGNAGLMKNEKIVLYSEGGIHSAQAWMLLRAQGYKGVYMLRGGLEEWKDNILFPSLASNATPQEKAEFEKAVHVSRFFGGTPRTGDAAIAEGPKMDMPKLQMPAPAGKTPTAATGKKKKEGC